MDTNTKIIATGLATNINNLQNDCVKFESTLDEFNDNTIETITKYENDVDNINYAISSINERLETLRTVYNNVVHPDILYRMIFLYGQEKYNKDDDGKIITNINDYKESKYNKLFNSFQTANNKLYTDIVMYNVIDDGETFYDYMMDDGFNALLKGLRFYGEFLNQSVITFINNFESLIKKQYGFAYNIIVEKDINGDKVINLFLDNELLDTNNVPNMFKVVGEMPWYNVLIFTPGTSSEYVNTKLYEYLSKSTLYKNILKYNTAITQEDDKYVLNKEIFSETAIQQIFKQYYSDHTFGTNKMKDLCYSDCKNMTSDVQKIFVNNYNHYLSKHYGMVFVHWLNYSKFIRLAIAVEDNYSKNKKPFIPTQPFISTMCDLYIEAIRIIYSKINTTQNQASSLSPSTNESETEQTDILESETEQTDILNSVIIYSDIANNYDADESIIENIPWVSVIQ